MNKSYIVSWSFMVLLSLSILLACGSSSSSSTKQLDVLVLVDDSDTNTHNGNTEIKIAHFMAVSNTIFENSGLNVKVKVVRQVPYTFKHNDSSDVLDDIAYDENVREIRNEVKADFVIAYRKYANDGLCGVAYLNNTLDERASFSHVTLDCPSTTTAHEIGHGMGLAHSIKDNTMGIYTYARGFGVDGHFVTTMAYAQRYNTNVEAYNYSSPQLNYEGIASGVNAEDEVSGADAVKALKETAPKAAKFR